MQRIASRIAHVPHHLVDGIRRASVERAPKDLAVVGDSDEDHSPICVGEGDRGLLKLVAADPFLELKVLALLSNSRPNSSTSKASCRSVR